jgi:hypothetical protein
VGFRTPRQQAASSLSDDSSALPTVGGEALWHRASPVIRAGAQAAALWLIQLIVQLVESATLAAGTAFHETCAFLLAFVSFCAFSIWPKRDDWRAAALGGLAGLGLASAHLLTILPVPDDRQVDVLAVVLAVIPAICCCGLIRITLSLMSQSLGRLLGVMLVVGFASTTHILALRAVSAPVELPAFSLPVMLILSTVASGILIGARVSDIGCSPSAPLRQFRASA